MWGKVLTGASVGAATVGMGAASGAYIAAQSDANSATGATVGGAIGLGASVGTIALGANLDKIGKWAGTKALNTGKGLWEYAKSPEAKVMASNVGQKALAIGKTAGAVGLKAGIDTGAVGATMALKAGAKYGNIVSGMFKMNPMKETKGGLLKMTKRGVAMAGVGALAVGSVDAFKNFEAMRAGASDGQVLTATPTMARSSSMRNAGATGDLAFAMRAQRHG